MLTVFLNWLYMLFTLFCMGFAFSKFSEKALGYSLKRVESILLAGVVASTVYAQIFSLFYRVNIEANIILLVFCAVVCVCMGKEMAGVLKRSWQGSSAAYKILLLFLFLVWGLDRKSVV